MGPITVLDKTTEARRGPSSLSIFSQLVNIKVEAVEAMFDDSSKMTPEHSSGSQLVPTTPFPMGAEVLRHLAPAYISSPTPCPSLSPSAAAFPNFSSFLGFLRKPGGAFDVPFASSPLGKLLFNLQSPAQPLPSQESLLDSAVPPLPLFLPLLKPISDCQEVCSF